MTVTTAAWIQRLDGDGNPIGERTLVSGVSTFELTLPMQLTKFGRRFFARMCSTRPAVKANKHYGYGR